MTMGKEPVRDKAHFYTSRAMWRTWLQQNHGGSGGIWLAIAKKHADGLHYDDAVEEALCYGWIDSTVRKLDEDYFQQWYSPRRAGSIWSRSNKQRVERLIAEGKMTTAGLAVVNRARDDGSWDALDQVEKLAVPDDLGRVLAENHQARKAYEELPPSQKKQYLYWINSAKRDDTRERRVRETIERLTQD